MPPDHVIPSAVTATPRRISFAWIVPGLVLLLAGWLAWAAWIERGTVVTIELRDGRGIKPGDAVRFRGITVGEVRDIELADDLETVYIRASLTTQADNLARSGTRFWVVRPRISLSGADGLETLVGPRYIAVLPTEGDNPRQRRFVGLDNPPIVNETQPGDLEIIVQLPERGSVSPGAPLLYRQVRIGTVLTVGLASDGGGVESRVHVERPFVPLIRTNTRLWDSGGLQAEFGLGGASVNLPNIESLLTGSLSLATPPPDSAGEVVRTGHRFEAAREPEDEWRAWKPLIALGSRLLPPGEVMPRPLRAHLTWREGRIGRFMPTDRSQTGWVLQTESGIIGPEDLLTVAEDAENDTAMLECNGRGFPLTGVPEWTGDGVCRRAIQSGATPVDVSRMRRPVEPEDCLLIADPTGPVVPLAAANVSADPDRGGWRVDASMPLDRTWHGALVVSRHDAAIVGMMIVGDDEDDGSRITFLPADSP